MLRSLLFTCSCIACVLHIFAQEYAPPIQLSGRTGLSHRWVNHIMQDSKGFLWFSTIDGLNRYDGIDFIAFRPSDQDTLSESGHDWIWWAVEDADGLLRVCTKTGMHRFDVDAGRFTFFPFRSWSVSGLQCLNAIGIAGSEEDLFWKAMSTYPWPHDSIAFYAFTDTGNPEWVRSWNGSPPGFFFSVPQDHAWIWTQTNGWMLLNILDGSTRSFGLNGTQTVSGTQVLPIDTKQKMFWTPVGDGSIEFQKIPLSADPESLVCENFLRDDQGNWWFTTGHSSPRLYRFDNNTKLSEEIGPLPIPLIYSVCEDKEGTIWVGHQLGVSKFIRIQRLFQNFLHIPFSPGAEAPLGVACRSMVEDKYGNIYIEDRHALYRLPRHATVAERLAMDLLHGDNKTVDASPRYLFADGDSEIWMSVQSGIARYDPITQKIVLFDDPEFRGQFFQILEDKQGRFWIQMDDGREGYKAVLFNKSSGKFSYAKCRNVNLDYGVMQPDADVLWAFHPKGVLKIDCTEEKVDSIFLYEDIREQRQAVFTGKEMWIASSRGLVKVDMQTWQQTTFERSHGLPADFVYSILPDTQYLWLGTADGLCRFNVRTYETKNYFTSDGLSHNEFNTQAVLKTRDGRYVMGGLNGINVFRPEVLNAPGTYRPNLHWMSFSKYDGQARVIKEFPAQAYDPQAGVVLHHTDKSFTFRFALTSYRDHSKNRYTYYLEGLEEDWRSYDASPVAAYASIPPGEYTLRVKAMDPNGGESVNSLSVRIIMRGPWYTRWWAFLLYGLLVVGISFVVYRYLLRRKLEHAENLRLRELDILKTKIYTSITHEFRTPLTIILGLTRQWLRRKDPASVHEDEYRTVERNGQRLLQLVNQILDLRKIESGHMKPSFVLGDVTILLRYIFDSFHSYAIAKEIDFRSEIPAESIVMDHDPDKLTKIVSNLLSNALKFTPEGGSVVLRIEQIDSHHPPQLLIEVSDTGSGIPAEDLPHVFNKFFQVDNAITRTGVGTGIGLTLTKELVELLHGTIDVKSEPGIGSVFTVMLPVSHHAKLSEHASVHSVEDQAGYLHVLENINDDENILPDRPCVLIVEDNAEVARYTASCLGKEYQVRFAVNGEEGINKACAVIPDLVISDVMMPLKDGFELLRILKNDLRTSHIPVILLTARAEIEDRLEGLRRGADAYLSKPFVEEELQILSVQLLELRKKLQLRYANTTIVQGTEQVSAEEGSKSFDLEIEDAFYREVMHILEANYENASFSNEELYRRMHMSRTQLHRKLSALTGYSPNQLLMQIRLRKAKELLSDTDAPVSEIAYTTGFNQPSYFARTFARDCGQTPSEYRARHRQKS